MLVPHLLMQADYPRHEGRVKSVILPYRGYWYVRHLYHGRDELHRVCTRREDMEGGGGVTTTASLPWPREERQSVMRAITLPRRHHGRGRRRRGSATDCDSRTPDQTWDGSCYGLRAQ